MIIMIQNYLADLHSIFSPRPSPLSDSPLLYPPTPLLSPLELSSPSPDSSYTPPSLPSLAHPSPPPRRPHAALNPGERRVPRAPWILKPGPKGLPPRQPTPHPTVGTRSLGTTQPLGKRPLEKNDPFFANPANLSPVILDRAIRNLVCNTNGLTYAICGLEMSEFHHLRSAVSHLHRILNAHREWDSSPPRRPMAVSRIVLHRLSANGINYCCKTPTSSNIWVCDTDLWDHTGGAISARRY
jgi:hypothetical protein